MISVSPGETTLTGESVPYHSMLPELALSIVSHT
jgi:hypothetical protein